MPVAPAFWTILRILEHGRRIERATESFRVRLGCVMDHQQDRERQGRLASANHAKDTRLALQFIRDARIPNEPQHPAIKAGYPAPVHGLGSMVWARSRNAVLE